MISYAILANPGHNRVYFESSIRLSLSELEIASKALHASCGNIRTLVIAGIPYIVFDCEERLGDSDSRIVSRLSFAYAIFILNDAGGSISMTPVEKSGANGFDSGISTILKYTGKTNELFTRLMINAALFSSDYANEKKIRLLDPVAGKGTTLFEGICAGMEVCGIEIGSKAVQEACSYFKKFLESGKYKHGMKSEKISGPGKSFTARLYDFEFARNKNDMKDPDKIGRLCMSAGDSRYANHIYRKNSFHLIVGDMPYGVAHGNVTNEKQSSLTRNPSELLAACLPAWYDVLKPGGAMVLAWNSFVLPPRDMSELLESHNFQVISGSAYDNFEHMVDRSIKRNIFVAKKPKP